MLVGLTPTFFPKSMAAAKTPAACATHSSAALLAACGKGTSSHGKRYVERARISLALAMKPRTTGDVSSLR